jgi:hypothetical protein
VPFGAFFLQQHQSACASVPQVPRGGLPAASPSAGAPHPPETLEKASCQHRKPRRKRRPHTSSDSDQDSTPESDQSTPERRRTPRRRAKTNTKTCKAQMKKTSLLLLNPSTCQSRLGSWIQNIVSPAIPAQPNHEILGVAHIAAVTLLAAGWPPPHHRRLRAA